MKHTFTTAVTCAMAISLLTSCATKKIDQNLITPTDNATEQHATIYAERYYPDDTYTAIDKIGCTKKWSGAYTSDSHYTRFKKLDNKTTYLMLKPGRVVSIHYQHNYCVISGRLSTRAGKQYLAVGGFDGKYCSLTIKDKKTGKTIPFYEDPIPLSANCEEN